MRRHQPQAEVGSGGLLRQGYQKKYRVVHKIWATNEGIFPSNRRLEYTFRFEGHVKTCINGTASGDYPAQRRLRVLLRHGSPIFA